MLLDFTVTNYRSFKKQTEFDMYASSKGTKSKLDRDSVAEIHPKGIKKDMPLLLSSVMYGPNAGGKTNFIIALYLMRKIVKASDGNKVLESISPFKFDKAFIEKPTEFKVTFIAEDNVVYEYGISATNQAIKKEWLFAYPKGRKQVWYVRTGNQYKFGALTGDKEVWKRATTPQRLFLSTANQLNSQQLKPVYDWFDKKLKFIGPDDITPGFTADFFNTATESEEKAKWKKDILSFLKAADFAISNIALKERELSEHELKEIASHIPEEYLEAIKNEKVKEISTIHQSSDGSDVYLNFGEESTGTQKMFGLAAPLLASLEKGLVFVVDELHNSLHPDLVVFLVKMFHDKKINKKNAQLIFTTHDPSLLNSELFDSDQVWFCKRNEKQESELYSLMEFKPRKDITNIEKAYLSGRFGAVPFIRKMENNGG